MLKKVFILEGKVFTQDLRLCRQRTAGVEAVCACVRSVDDKFTGSVQTYSCHSTLHALPLNAPATAHNDTLYLRMMCFRRPEVNQAGEKMWRGPRVGPCLLFTGLRVAPGPEKTGAEKHSCFGGEAAPVVL